MSSEHTTSRPAVSAERCTDPQAAAALREHRADRGALLESLTASLEADRRVRAAWLWGSFGRGEADDLSDLDPWIVVVEEAVPDMGASLRLYAQRAGTFLIGGEGPQNAPPGRGFFSSLHAGRHGLLHADCYWQPQSAVAEVPARAVLFDRLREPYVPTPPPVVPEPTALTPGQERIAGGIGFAWMMLSIAAKTLARDPDSDMALMLYPRPGLEEAANLLGLSGYLGPPDWAVPERPLEKVQRLRHVAAKTARLVEAANGRGLDLSPRLGICLSRYLDLVESVLR